VPTIRQAMSANAAVAMMQLATFASHAARTIRQAMSAADGALTMYRAMSVAGAAPTTPPETIAVVVADVARTTCRAISKARQDIGQLRTG